ncbi:mitochondrial carrier protein [Ditylenchus destructor]|nr:mitochondrial carrier protein [Ditylenchus destructor]
MSEENRNGDVGRWLLCGAVAGLAVDLSLYPLDTIKTRLQSRQGFIHAGGFKNIYRGMSSVALGSAPGSALFFLTYSSTKYFFPKESPLSDALRASLGEIAACMVRVPTELIKQRAQVTGFASTSKIAREIYSSNGFRGFYRGYVSTVTREIPFSFIEFPIWEYLKRWVSQRKDGKLCTPFESACCGSVAGSIAAAITTPLDVAKTRIMLNRGKTNKSVITVIRQILKEENAMRLYSGVVPRSCWMGLGGFIFFFAYEFSMKLSYISWFDR